MKKRILSLALVVIMIAIMLSSFTMAYFTDEEQAANVMTIGNVQINVEERTYDHVNQKWVEFENEALTLYPVKTDDHEARKATGQMWNKVVRTFNESEDPAYIRTIIAVERIVSANEWGSAVGLGFSCDFNVNPIVAEIDGVTYDVYVCTAVDKKPIENGKYLGSLQSVWLYDDVTQEEVKDAGNLEILVLSQGIQSAGLTHEAAMEALGEVNETNLNTWFEEAEEANTNDRAFS